MEYGGSVAQQCPGQIRVDLGAGAGESERAMKPYLIAVGSILIAAAALPLAAQVPSLGSIEAPYPAIQTTVHVAGGTYVPGAVAYGQVGAPLVLTGSNFGTTGTVQFLGYMNGAPDGRSATASVSLWTSTMLILTVPSGAFTGLVKVTTSGGTSNGLPFIITPGSYPSICPVAPDDSDFQVVTSSLQDGAVGRSYSVALSATGGLPPYTWASVGTALPSGLSLSSAGVISGTPATGSAGTVSLTIQARDNNHLVTQALLNLKIDSSFLSTGPVYTYSATYDGVGNVSSNTDSVMGAWSFQYDTLNRLALGNASTGDYDGQYACWNYDSFGNRQQQVFSSAAFVSGSGGSNACQAPSNASVATDLATYTSNNQIAETNAPGVVAAPGYDAAGSIVSDGVSNYLYDAEGRVCAVAYTPTPGNTSYYGYEYDAEGNRVAKGTITTWSCDPSVSGLSYTESYVLSPGGQQLTMLDGTGHWQRTNVYAGGLLATYDATNLHFHLSDPLGTRRVQTNAAGYAETDCESLPFGDEMTCFAAPNAPNTADDSTPLHFTGKERDTESGNDYFGARYYASSMGRFMSPDWGLKIEPVPFAQLNDPQSLNLYSYVRNNPLRKTDPDGHCDVDGEHHGGVWCFFHALGMTETQHELANDARAAMAPMHNLIFQGQRPQDVAKSTDDKAVNQYFNKLSDQLMILAASGSAPGGNVGLAASAIGPGFAGLKNATPVGSALKDDLAHQSAFWMRDEAAEGGAVFKIIGGDGVQRTLIQIPGEVNGVAGRFEYIVDQAGNLTHEMFVEGGGINGVPIKP